MREALFKVTETSCSQFDMRQILSDSSLAPLQNRPRGNRDRDEALYGSIEEQTLRVAKSHVDSDRT